MTEIPEAIAQLTNLTTLNLAQNRLTEIPEAIAQLTNLTTLNLNYNKLNTLPEAIAQLTNLTTLNLAQNRLTEIPEAIAFLPNLKTLELEDNPLESPPIEIASKGLEAIRDYFRQLQPGVDYDYEAKLIIVGSGGAGKTTLANKIINPEYKLNPQEASTEGIDILKWSFPIIDKKGQKREFKVNIWDFGGQEIYHTTHQFFLTKRSLYALVADTRKEDTDFPYWLNIVELLSDRSPLIIVKNEKGDRKIEINERQLKGQFESLKESFAINLAKISKTKSEGDRYKEIIKSCKYYFGKLPHIGDVVPKTWKEVRETLEQDKRNYMSLEEYLNICEKNGIEKEEDKLQLSGYLHDLGVILHFQEDLVLEQTLILKPEWGTDAVYKVLDSTTVINNLGQFSERDLREIWKEKQYAGKRKELLQLMQKFQLCYELPHKKNNYIAPQLLSLDKPEYSWDSNKNLLLRYDYEFMPKGIITRFIVAVHYLIQKQQLVWRNGVILDRDKTRAEVIESYDRKKIFIRVSGNKRRELMTIITNELDLIHNSYGERLKVDKLIPCDCSICKKIEEPYFYRFEVLDNFKQKGVYQIQCQKSAEMVNILRITENVFVADKKIRMNNNKIIENYKRRLQILEEQQAMKGADCPPHIIMEIDDIKQKINDLNIGKKINQEINPNTGTQKNITTGNITGENANVINSSGENATFDLSRGKTEKQNSPTSVTQNFYGNVGNAAATIQGDQSLKDLNIQQDSYEAKSYGSGDAIAGKEVTNKSKNLNIKAEIINASGAASFSQIDNNKGNIGNIINQNTTTNLTIEDISSLIKDLGDAISGANLSDKEKNRFKRDLDAIAAELVDEPDKEEVEYKLEGVTNRINKLSKTLEEAKLLQAQVEPIIERILGWVSSD